MATRPTTARANRDSAESAALARVAELETELARERAESARRLKDDEARIRELRDALHVLKAMLKHAAQEQILLEARLAGDAHETERLTHRVADLEEQILRGTARPGASSLISVRSSRGGTTRASRTR